MYASIVSKYNYIITRLVDYIILTTPKASCIIKSLSAQRASVEVVFSPVPKISSASQTKPITIFKPAANKSSVNLFVQIRTTLEL